MTAIKYLSRIKKGNKDIYIKDAEARDAVEYRDVYVGVGATSSAVMIEANHHDSVLKYRPVALTASSDYLWVIMPTEYAPVALMNGMEVPMVLDGTAESGSVSYSIWKSNDPYSGSFNIFLT